MEEGETLLISGYVHLLVSFVHFRTFLIFKIDMTKEFGCSPSADEHSLRPRWTNFAFASPQQNWDWHGAERWNFRLGASILCSSLSFLLLPNSYYSRESGSPLTSPARGLPSAVLIAPAAACMGKCFSCESGMYVEASHYV